MGQDANEFRRDGLLLSGRMLDLVLREARYVRMILQETNASSNDKKDNLCYCYSVDRSCYQ